jgi:hypothetical protein
MGPRVKDKEEKSARESDKREWGSLRRAVSYEVVVVATTGGDSWLENRERKRN